MLLPSTCCRAGLHALLASSTPHLARWRAAPAARLTSHTRPARRCPPFNDDTASQQYALGRMVDGRIEANPGASRGILLKRAGHSWHAVEWLVIPSTGEHVFAPLTSQLCDHIGLRGGGGVLSPYTPFDMQFSDVMVDLQPAPCDAALPLTQYCAASQQLTRLFTNSEITNLACSTLRLVALNAPSRAASRRQGDVEMLVDGVWCVQRAEACARCGPFRARSLPLRSLACV